MFNEESFPYAGVQAVLEEYYEAIEDMLPYAGVQALLQQYYENRD